MKGEPTAGGQATRRYDNRNRLEQAAATRERVVAAGAELLRGSSVRDWRSLTVRAVADRAGVSERTVYRHFGTEKGLRDAIMERQEEQAGIDLGSVHIDDLAEVAARVLRYAAEYPREPEPPLDATLQQADARRRAALLRAVEERTHGWSGDEQRRAAAVIDLIWSLGAFERLQRGWQMDRDEAIDVVRWGIGLVVDVASAQARTARGGPRR